MVAQPPLANNADGGTNGVTVTTGNSGGGSGTAWDNVFIGSGGGSGTILKYDNSLMPATNWNGSLVYHGYTDPADPAGSAFCNWDWGATLGAYAPPVTMTVRLARTAYPASFSLFSNYVYGILFHEVVAFWISDGVYPTATPGQIGIVNTTGILLGNFTNVIPLNQWFRFETTIDPLANTVVASLYSNPGDASPLESIGPFTISNSGTVGAGSLGWGIGGSNPGVGDMWWDNAYANVPDLGTTDLDGYWGVGLN